MTNCRYLFEGSRCLHPESGVYLCVLLKPSPKPGVYIACKLEHGMPRVLSEFSDCGPLRTPHILHA